MEDRTSTGPLDKDERTELLRLRDEVATLRGQAAGAAAGVPAEPVARPPRNGLRWTAVTILLVLVAVLALASVTARFTRSQILDTDRYVSTIAPSERIRPSRRTSQTRSPTRSSPESTSRGSPRTHSRH